MDQSTRIAKKKARFKQLQEIKRPFDRMFELIARYIDMRSVTFSEQSGRSQTVNIIPEELMNNDVSHISDSASSSLLGALWPNGANSFTINRHRTIPDSEMVKRWFRDTVNPTMLDVMDEPQNGLLVAFEEAFAEYMNYGVTSVNVRDNVDEYSKPVSYSCWDIKQNFIDENEDKFVDTVYRLRFMDVRTVVNKYGLDKVSKQTRKLYADQKYEDKVAVLITIEPRSKEEISEYGNRGMPYETCHIEFDNNVILKEGGFPEFPVPTGRFKKKPDEVWGRGSGGHALPDVIELNAVWEGLTIALEKFLDPPLGVLDDGRLGSSSIDTSAGGISVFDVNGLSGNSNPVFTLFTTGEPSAATILTEKLVNSITQHFMLDRLLDLNNQTEMTLGEANIRNSLRSDSLRKVYARATAEIILPVINRTFNILFRRGYFGVIPGSELELELILMGREVTYLPDEIIQAIEQGKDFYEVEFVSPAARMLQAEEANGITQVLGIANEVRGNFPEVLDSFDVDRMVQRLSRILGVSVNVLYSTDVVQTIRQNRAQAQATQQQIETAREVSEINRNNAQAQATQSNGFPV